MGSGIGKETINVVNNQFNSAKEHLKQTMEEHKDSFVWMTIVTLIALAAVMMILYACSRFCLQKLRRSMSSKKAVGHFILSEPNCQIQTPHRRNGRSCRRVERGEEERKVGPQSYQAEQDRVLGGGRDVGHQDDGHAERALELATRLGEIVWGLQE